MKTIRNKTVRPLKVPLPRGKFVHLGPHNSGEIADNAADHPPLVKLVEAGDLEILGHGSHDDPRAASSGAPRESTQGHNPAITQRRGDR